ncbi:MAG: GNAT family N-acetyltransferase [Gaiellales bacterium]
MSANVRPMVSLRPITEDNLRAVEALRVAPGQGRFVSSVVDSMIEAVEDPAGRAMYWAVYAGDTPVGFVMISDEVAPDSPGHIPHYLWKLLIDHRHQGRGHGSAALDLIVEYFRARPGVDVLRTSAGQGEGSPIAFYERYGFQRSGEIVFDDEVLLQLRIR